MEAMSDLRQYSSKVVLHKTHDHQEDVDSCTYLVRPSLPPFTITPEIILSKYVLPVRLFITYYRG